MMGSNRMAAASAAQPGAWSPANRAASAELHASTTASKNSPSTSHPWRSGCSALTRLPVKARLPWRVNHSKAGSGSKVCSDCRGSKRSAEPGPLNRASFRTRRKTWALAREAGVLSAATHKGSISSCRTAGGSFWHSRSTVQCVGQVKPRSAHAAAWPRSCSRSTHPHPLQVITAAPNISQAGPPGMRRPRPSG